MLSIFALSLTLIISSISSSSSGGGDGSSALLYLQIALRKTLPSAQPFASLPSSSVSTECRRLGADKR